MATLVDPAECGPVTLALCQDVQTEACDYPEAFFQPRAWIMRRQRPDARELERAAAALRVARAPLIVTGGGVHYSEACDRLAAFAERHGIPVAETQAGKSALPWSHPCSVGAIGVTGTEAANAIARAADLIIAVGTRLQDFTTGSWSLFQNPDARLVTINAAAFDAGDIGDVELVQITSRDPAPPPIAFVERSGGLFHDMMIHDFDTARSLIGKEIVDVTVMGSVLIDKAIGEAGDVDTGAVMLCSSSGRLALISNSRQATYGYDQRVEVHGAGGMMSAGNPVATTITRADGTGFATDPLGNFFMDRYADAFRFQIEAFCAVVRANDVTYPDGIDGLAALAIADAAAQSLVTGRTVTVPDPRSLP